VGVADPVFVQPHFDDVALSCGGTVACFAEIGSPSIVTVFAGEPGTAQTDFAKFQHERWQLDEINAVAARQSEDERAAAALGASVTVVWLSHLDAIYRDEAYSSDDALFGQLMESDLGLVEQIADDLDANGDLFAVPLGVGNHVDHQLVFRAGQLLRERGNVVWCYADMPYALDTRAFSLRHSAIWNAVPCRRLVTRKQFNDRWNAIQCYESQLPVIFRELPDARERFERFGVDQREDGPVELFWSMDDIEGPRI
jgi:LmbE family N-acetylglucosaminyl deacetylase